MALLTLLRQVEMNSQDWSELLSDKIKVPAKKVISATHLPIPSITELLHLSPGKERATICSVPVLSSVSTELSARPRRSRV